MKTIIQKFSKLVALLVCALGVGSAMAAWNGIDKTPARDTSIGGKNYYIIENEANLAWFSDTVNTYASLQQATAYLKKDLKKWLNTYKDTVSNEMSKTIAGLYLDGIEEISAIADNNEKNVRAQAIAKEIFSLSREDAIRVTSAILKSNDEKVWIDLNAVVTAPYLDMGGKPFIPIAAGSGAMMYKGVFDGNGVTISNLSVHSDFLESKAYVYGQNVGMFGAISGGTVKNLILDNVDIQAHGQVQDYLASANSFVSTGAIVGWLNSGTIEGCYVSGNVDTYKKGQAVGGIVGTAFNGTIKNTLSVATIKVAGDNAFVGGIAGRVKSGTVKIESSVYDGSLLQNTGNDGAMGGLVGLVTSKVSIVDGYYDSDAATGGVGTVDASGSVIGDNTGVGNSVVNQEEYVCLLNKGTWNNGSCTGAKTNVWSKHTNITNQGITKDSNGNILYVINFDANGGSFPTGVSVVSKELRLGEPINTQGLDNPNPTSNSMVFSNKWSFSKNGEPENLGNAYKPVTIYAYWNKAYKITFLSEPGYFPDGTLQKEIWVEEGKPIEIDFELPTEYKSDGKKFYFGGWINSAGNPVQVLGAASQETSFYAAWTDAPTFNVVFDNQGHGTAPQAQQVLDKELATDPGDLTEKGYKFGGWYEDAACTKSFEFEHTQIEEDTRVYAKWERLTYNIAYDFDGANYNPADYPNTYHVDTVINLKQPVKEGYNFEGWFLDQSYNPNNLITHIQDTVGNLALYAKWKRITYIISYTPDELTKESMAKDEKDYDASINLKNGIFTADGRIQDGWSKTLNGDIDYNFGAEYSAKANLDLYPHWSIVDYNINYVLRGGKFSGTPVSSYNLESGKITFENPTKDGYIFKGWCTTNVTENCPKMVTSFEPKLPYGDTAFYALWEQITVTVKTEGKSKVFDGSPLVTPKITVTFSKNKEAYTVETATSTVSVTHVAEGEVEAVCDQLVIKNKAGEDVTDSFKIVTNYGTIKINPKPITFMGKTQTMTYTGEEITLIDMTISGGGLITGHTHNVAYNASGTEVGEYNGTITPVESVVIKDGEGTDVTSDYAITTTPGALTIKKANSFTVALENATIVYDAAAHANANVCSYTAKTGVTTCEYRFDGDANWTKNLDELTQTDAGTYTINVRATNPNYEKIATTTAKLIIEKRPVTVSAWGHIGSEMYDGAEHSVSGYEIGEPSDPLYNKSWISGPSQEEAKASRTDKGTTFMNLSFTNSNPNFDVTFDVTDGYIVIGETNDVIVTISGHKQTFAYDGAEHVVSGYDIRIDKAGFVKENFKFIGDSTVTGMVAGTFAMGLKEEDFQVLDKAGFDNVFFNVVDGDLTIKPVNTQITVTANSDSKGYDGTPLTNSVATVTQGVLLEGDVPSAVVVGSITNVGSVTNKVQSVTIKHGSVDVTASYPNIRLVDGTLTVYPVVVAKWGDSDTDTLHVMVQKCSLTEDLTKVPSCVRKQVYASIDSLSSVIGKTLPCKDCADTDTDSTYAFNTTRNIWKYNEDKQWFEPEFESLVKKVEIVVKYGLTPDDTIHLKVDVPATRDDDLLNKAIVNGLNSHNPRIPLPTKAETEDSTYAFAQKWKLEDGAYVPVFTSSVKTQELTVVYGGKWDFFMVEVHVTDDQDQILQKINDEATAQGIVPKPAKPSADSVYAFKTWVKDANDDLRYVAEFTVDVKKATIVVVVGPNPEDSVKVIVDVTDDEDGIANKIDSTLANHVPPIVPGPTVLSPDSVYTLVEWKKDPVCDTCYVPVFTADVRKDTLVVAYAPGKSITTIVEATDDDETIVKKIDSTLANHVPPIVPEPTNPHKDSGYVFQNWKKDADKHYVPEFKAVEKYGPIVVAYGDKPSDTLEVIIEVLASAEEISKTINDSLTNKGIPLPPKVKEDEDSTYALDGWKKNENTGHYEPDVVGVVKKDTIVVQYGAKPADTIKVEIHVTDGSARINQKINAAIKTHDPEIPTPTKESTAEMAYAFNKTWHKNDETGRYEPGFDAVHKSVEYVIKYGEGFADTIHATYFVSNVNTQEKLDESVNKTLGQYDIDIPKKSETEDSTFELHWVKAEPEGWLVPEFEGIPKSKVIVVAYGDAETDTVWVTVNVVDSDSIIEEKIIESLPLVPGDTVAALPTKDADSTHVYEFEKFVLNDSTNMYEPVFEKKARVFKVFFNLPSEGELLAEFNGYTYGKVTMLPGARIKGDSTWEFKGWYQKTNGLGERYKAMRATDYGDKYVYPLFQKTISYDANGDKGEIVVVYSGSAERAINRALAGVIPEDYTKGEKTYTFKEWKLDGGVYKAEMTSIPYVRKAVPRFSVAVADRALEISGASVGKILAVFDMQGRVVFKDRVARGTQRVELARPGNYIVRVNNQNVQVNVK